MRISHERAYAPAPRRATRFGSYRTAGSGPRSGVSTRVGTNGFFGSRTPPTLAARMTNGVAVASSVMRSAFWFT